MSNGARIEVLWAFRDNGEDVEQWLPGVLVNRHQDGRSVVKMDNGWYCNDAAPENVRGAE
jgi:transposase